MRPRRVLVLVAVAFAVATVGLLVGLATNEASSQQHWPGVLEVVRTHPWQSLAFLVVAAASLTLIGVLVGRDRSVDRDRSDLTLEGVADRLAIAMRRQWEDEAAWRQLNDPYAMSVRWDPADPTLVVEWRSIVRLATSGPGWPPTSKRSRWASRPSRLAGIDNELVDVLERVPTGRLIVLGEPGAGKTILLVRLMLDLLSRRRPGDAVPILVPLASWNPADEDLATWVVRWLITDKPALATPVPGGARVSQARALLDAGLLLLLLDGMDEIPDLVRGFAITQLNDAMRPGVRMVLASRTAAYRAAVRADSGVEVRLTGAAGIELCQLDASVVGDYLKDSAGGSTSAERWNPVLWALASNPQEPAARALTTPLMAALARVIYNPRPDEQLAAIPHPPTELLDQVRFPTREAVEHHLFDGFITAAYRPHPDPARRGRWSAKQAERWLAFLARDLEHRQGGTTDLAWWKLAGAAPRSLASGTVGFVAGIAALAGYSLPIGIGSGLICTLVVGLLVYRWAGRAATAPLSKGLAGGMTGGILGALAGVAMFGSGIGQNRIGSFLAGGVAFGIAIAPMGRFASGLSGAFAGAVGSRAAEAIFGYALGPGARVVNALGIGLTAAVTVGLASRGSPARGLRWTGLGFVSGLASGVTIGFVVWIQVGIAGGVVVGLAGVVGGAFTGGLIEAAPTDVTKSTAPITVLKRDRATFSACWWGVGLSTALSTGLAMALSPSISTGIPNGLRFGLGVGVANLVAIGLAFGFLQASWGSFVLARCWLAGTSHLPLRLMAFLTDAHTHRGVLRQAGSVYQFRHVELQRRLAGMYENDATWKPSIASSKPGPAYQRASS